MITRSDTVWVAALAIATAIPGYATAQSGARARRQLEAQARARDQANLTASASASTGAVIGEVEPDSIALPTNPRLWRNSPPLTLAALEGKGVVFYLFEEECATCAQQWPALNAMAAKHQGDPVVFLAVNSGSDPRTINRYVQRNRVSWPLVYDTDRSLENALGVSTISPDGSLYAVRYISGEGTLAEGFGADFEKTVAAALKGAAWRVDPAGLPGKLINTWKSIELGDFASAAGALKKSSESKDEDLKAGANKLLEAVQDELLTEARAAGDAMRNKRHWDAYKKLDSLVDRFEGYEFPLLEQAQSERDKLAERDDVQGEISAAKLLEKAVAAGSKGSPAAIRRAKGMLKKLVDSHSGSEAASKATELLASLDR